MLILKNSLFHAKTCYFFFSRAEKNISKLPCAVGLGRATRSIIMQNLAIALGVIDLLFSTSLTGIISIGIVVVFHEGSNLVVVPNALRLLGFRERSISI